VFDVGASTHNAVGTMGAKINAAGAAGDPWAVKVTTTTYPDKDSAGRKLHEDWKERLR